MQSIYETVLDESGSRNNCHRNMAVCVVCKSRNVYTAGVQQSTNEISFLDLISGIGIIDRSECESNTNERTSCRTNAAKRNE